MLGSELARTLSACHEVFGTVRRAELAYSTSRFTSLAPQNLILSDISIDRATDCFFLIKDLKPEIIANCIGVTKQNPCLDRPIETIFLNSLVPHLVQSAAQKIGCKVIHFSTDCVFSGVRGPYTEQTPPDPVDFYGQSKLLGEVSSGNSLTIRSSIVGFSIDGTNRGLFDWFASNRGGVVTGYEQALYSGVTTLEMSKIVMEIIENHLDMSGIWQVSADPIDKASLLSLLNREMGLGITIERDQKFKCDRRLVSDRFRQRTGWSPPTWDVMIKELVDRLRQSNSDIKG